MQPSGQQAGNSIPASWLRAGPGTLPGVGRVGREGEAEGWRRVRGERLPSVKGGAKRGWEVEQGRAWRRAFRTFSPRGTPPGCLAAVRLAGSTPGCQQMWGNIPRGRRDGAETPTQSTGAALVVGGFLPGGPTDA